VTLVDPLTGETVVSPATLLVALGNEHKMYDRYNPLEATLSSRMIQPGTQIAATIVPKHGKWDQTMASKYRYELVHRVYTAEQISTLRWESAPITHTIDTIVSGWSLTGSKLNIVTLGYTPWEYILRISPITPTDILPPTESISETLIYLTGDYTSRDSTLRVIPERTVYHDGDIAHVLITTPFSSGGYLYITRERWGVLEHEYVAYTGSNYTRDYQIDDSFYPNLYIGVVAFPRWGTSDRWYAVGYGEIIMDLSEKKWNLSITPNKAVYKNRDTVTTEVILTDHTGKWVEWELEVMVIDESLIRLLGNIDLDIIPKFFQKYQFTMKTALTAIGIERNRYLSRKGSNGGSGDKWWDGTQISSRTLFKNTAYYNPSILTDKNGKAKISFQLPDNVTDYRIIVIGQTHSSQFSVSEKTISVRRDYTLETHAPSLAYPGDTTTITASVFNSTTQITGASVELIIGTGGSLLEQSESIILQPSQSVGQDYKVVVWKVWNGDIPYTLRLRDKKWIILDSLSKILHISQPPIIADMSRISWSTDTGVTLSLPAIGHNTSPDSRVTISISDSPLQNPDRVIATLIAYPYGCIEQTISSTLPNAIAIQLWSSLGIKMDSIVARKNLEAGVAKILKMQDANGGWKYWENDTMVNDHITPYVIRSLYEFRKLGVTIPDEAISRGLEYVANIPMFPGGLDTSAEADNQSEIFSTLAQGKHPKAKIIQQSIDISKLSRHGYLMYSVGLASLGQIDAKTKQSLKSRMSSRNSETYWYWDDTADQAIYARLLVEIGERSTAANMIRDLLQWVDMESYYVSTQSRIQLLMTLISLSGNQSTPSTLQITTSKLKIPVSISKWIHRYSYDTRRSLIGTALDIARLAGTGIIYYDISLRDEPIDIFAVQPITHPELSVSRVFEQVDESRWLDTDGQFISASPITDGIFHKWQLYRVRITVTPKPSNRSKYYLTLEDYIPGGWRPIQWLFKTESSSTRDASSEYGYWNGWTHVESQLDRILATQDYIWQTDQPYTYTYYIRPDYVGTYLLPPVTAYYMYQPQIHATGKYAKIIVQ
jgi:alpha-2-macroglobulin